MQHIIEPQTKPASEWIAGRVVQKVSPTARHANAQGRLVAAFMAWADATGIGRIGTEWEFRIAPPGEVVRSLVPDVAFLSYDKLGFDDDEAAEMPAIAPNVAVEVLSPNDRRRNVDEKIRVYLACGTSLVAVADPERQNVTLHDANGILVLEGGDILRHSELPNFAMPVAAIFAKPGQR
jgi:Uma2 family endonuclease